MQRSAIEQIENAVALLRRQGPDTWSLYVTGIVPFILAVLSFIRDMTSGYGEARCLAEAVLCALAFLWLSFWKSRFTGALAASLARDDDLPQRSSWTDCAAVQLPAQSLKLLVLPFAFLTVVPIPWSVAFFRALNYESSKRGVTLSSALAQAARQAATETKQNAGGLLLLFAGALLALVNFAVLVFALPWLVRMITGTETEWSRNQGSRFPLFCVAAALTWLFIDPILEAYSTLRCFQLEANSDGRDLLAAIRKLGAAAIILVALWGMPGHAANATSSNDLAHRIDHILATDREYNWTHSTITAAPPDSLAARLVDEIQDGLRHLDTALDHFFQWLGKLLTPEHQSEAKSKKQQSSKLSPWWLLGVLALIAIAVSFFVVRGRRASAPPLTQHARDAAVDIHGEAANAADRPDGEWLQLADEYTARGDFRLAMRALYLANLSYLGARQFISLGRSKTNGMYERELRQRARGASALQSFLRTNRGYERVWFGEHPATAELVTEFQNEAIAMRSHA